MITLDIDTLERIITFEDFWALVLNKVTKHPSKLIFNRLNRSEKKAIMQHYPRYIKSLPDWQSPCHPRTYLYQRRWEDEIIVKPDFPDKWDPKFIEKLEPKEMPKYWKHLRSLGYVPQMVGTGQKIWIKR